MAISLEQFNSLLAFETASWALWSQNFNKSGCIESNQEAIEGFLRGRISEFKGNIVLLGLNRSSNKRKKSFCPNASYPHCANFHGKGHAGDGFLCTTISKCDALQGAYMTDLSIDVQSDSSKIIINAKQAVEYLHRQLEILGSRSINIICFGQKVFSTFQVLTTEQPVVLPESADVLSLPFNYLDKTFRCYKVIHYSYAVRFNHQSRFKKQMEAVNNIIRQSAA